MFENRHEHEPHPDSELAHEEDWLILAKSAELLASVGEHFMVRERTIPGQNSHLVIREEVRKGAPSIFLLSAYKDTQPDPVVEFIFLETGEPEEMPEVAQVNRLGVAVEIEDIFKDVAETLDTTRSHRDQPLLTHLQNYAAYLRDDCRMGDNNVWLTANQGFSGRIRDAGMRTDSRISFLQRDYRSSSDMPEQLDVVQSIFTVGDRTALPDKPRLEIGRYTPEGDEIMAIVVSQCGGVEIISDPSRLDPYELTASGALTRYGARCVTDLLFDHMSVDLSYEKSHDSGSS